MTQTLINFRIDKKLKSDMEKICQELGINMSTAFTMFAKKMVREKRIPFEVSIDPYYAQQNINIDNLTDSQKANNDMNNLEHLAKKHPEKVAELLKGTLLAENDEM